VVVVDPTAALMEEFLVQLVVLVVVQVQPQQDQLELQDKALVEVAVMATTVVEVVVQPQLELAEFL
jgi:hypothetical protein